MDKNKIAVIFGASGLVGSALVQLLAKNKNYAKLLVANRSHIEYNASNIKEIIVDFEQLESYTELFEVDEVFVCLGTTIKKAGSKEQFQYVDLDLPEQIALLSKSAGVKTFCMISTMGANPKSSNFYSNTKGLAEEHIQQLQLEKSYFVRPSLLIGDREEKRWAEGAAQWLMKRINFLMLGPLKKYRAINDEAVAAAMIYIMEKHPPTMIFPSDKLQTFSNKYFQTHEHS